MITKSPEIIASQIFKMLRKEGLTPEQMLQVLEIARFKLQKLRG